MTKLLKQAPAFIAALRRPRLRDGETLQTLQDLCFSEKHLAKIEQRLDALESTKCRSDMSTILKARAAVLVPFCHIDNEPSVIFTLRAETLNSHSGEVSFPGGKMDDTDGSIIETAKRECHEEIALDPERILGVWNDLPNKTGTVAVSPVIAYCGKLCLDDLHPAESEVAEVFSVPVRDLLNPDLQSSWHSPRMPVPMPQFDAAQHRIWGLTAMFLSGVLNSVVLPLPDR